MRHPAIRICVSLLLISAALVISYQVGRDQAERAVVPQPPQVGTVSIDTYRSTGNVFVSASDGSMKERLRDRRGNVAWIGYSATFVAITCQYRKQGALPDPDCTPGAINHAVTQKTIKQTICVKGWTAKVRPSSSVTEPMKRISVRQYGFAFGTSMRGYEYDHLIPLELGGAPAAPSNLWPEPHHDSVGTGSFVKDGVENSLRARVCSGQMKLAAARKLIRSDWTKAR